MVVVRTDKARKKCYEYKRERIKSKNDREVEYSILGLEMIFISKSTTLFAKNYCSFKT